MRYAMVRGGVVENVIELEPDADFDPPEGVRLVALDELPVSIGWRFDGSRFSPPPEVPADPDVVRLEELRGKARKPGAAANLSRAELDDAIRLLLKTGRV